MNVLDSGTRDYNFTKQGYENLFEAAGQDPSNGARAFYATDALIGVGALFTPVAVPFEGPLTITGVRMVPAAATVSPVVLTHDAVQTGLSIYGAAQ